jgi:hypothetical protein
MTGTRPELPPLRIDLDGEDVGAGFAQLVLTVMELVRELLERQALRRVAAGDLSPEQVERLGTALRDIAVQLDELRAVVTEPGRGRSASSPTPAPSTRTPAEPAGSRRRNP